MIKRYGAKTPAGSYTALRQFMKAWRANRQTYDFTQAEVRR